MRKLFRDIALILLGVLCMAVSFDMFLVPARIAPGGVSGVATIVHYLFGLPVGAVSLALNIPLFLIGFRREGRAFTIKTLAATILFSLLLDTLRLPAVTEDAFLSVVFGGVLLGFGLGLVVLGDATTGGTDLAAKMIQRKIPHLSMAWVLFAIDFVVVLAAVFAFSPEEGLYALVTIFISSKVMDLMFEGIKSARAFTVFSAKSEEIAARILAELARGVTCWDAVGMYSGKGMRALYCVVQSREVTRLKRIIASEDPAAFVIISDVAEVGGEGFSSETPKDEKGKGAETKKARRAKMMGKRGREK